jgi:hypothetical protein
MPGHDDALLAIHDRRQRIGAPHDVFPQLNARIVSR